MNFLLLVKVKRYKGDQISHQKTLSFRVSEFNDWLPLDINVINIQKFTNVYSMQDRSPNFWFGLQRYNRGKRFKPPFEVVHLPIHSLP